jgi:hypothetical protein
MLGKNLLKLHCKKVYAFNSHPTSCSDLMGYWCRRPNNFNIPPTPVNIKEKTKYEKQLKFCGRDYMVMTKVIPLLQTYILYCKISDFTLKETEGLL